MTYRLIVDDNFHYMDPDERREQGSFSTLEAAIQAAKRIVDDHLQTAHTPGMSAQALLESYQSFGEDPWISAPEGGVPFSAWDYARRRCEEICAGSPPSPPPPDTGACLGYAGEALVESSYSRDQSRRAVITIDQRGRLDVHVQRWDTSAWASAGTAAWAELEDTRSADDLESARLLARRLVAEADRGAE